MTALEHLSRYPQFEIDPFSETTDVDSPSFRWLGLNPVSGLWLGSDLFHAIFGKDVMFKTNSNDIKTDSVVFLMYIPKLKTQNVLREFNQSSFDILIRAHLD